MGKPTKISAVDLQKKYSNDFFVTIYLIRHSYKLQVDLGKPTKVIAVGLQIKPSSDSLVTIYLTLEAF